MFCLWALLLIVLSDNSANKVAEKLKSTSLKQTTSAGVADVESQAVSSEDRGLRLESPTASDSDENAVWDSTPPKSNEMSEKDVQTKNGVQFSNKIINPDTKYSVTYLVQKWTKTNFTLDTGKWSPVSLIGAVCFYLTLFLRPLYMYYYHVLRYLSSASEGQRNPRGTIARINGGGTLNRGICL